MARLDTMVLELMTMGKQSAAHLGDLLRALPGEHQATTAELLRCCDRVIAALSRSAGKKKRKMMDHDGATAHPPPTPMPSKRRTRASEAHTEFESSTTADEFIWRKYGQKEINGCRHPRFYYRCAYSGCTATRRVQQSKDDPPAFVIAYYGEHTCKDAAVCQGGALLPPTVVDSGSNAWGGVHVDQNRDSPPPFIPAEQRCGAPPAGETLRGWSSSPSSSSSEVQQLDASPVLEFLDGSFDWESVINHLGFDDDLHQTALYSGEYSTPWI